MQAPWLKNKYGCLRNISPGTHVEIQVLNDLYTQAGGAPNISEATIATVYPDGGPFIACSNCTGIIGNAPNVDVITGTR